MHDNFGHLASANHFLNVARGELSKEKTAKGKEIWNKRIKELEEKIKKMS